MKSTRVFPIVSQSTLDEMTGVSCLNEDSLAAKNLLTDADLTQKNCINSLHSLIAYDQAKVNFSAKFPINWSPILSEPHQHLKHPQHIHSESVNFTKHWKNMANPSSSSSSATISISSPLSSNKFNQFFNTVKKHASTTTTTSSTTTTTASPVVSSATVAADDVLSVEIFLNKPIQVGCIQVKLKFSKELTAATSSFEMTLSRPKNTNNNNSSSSIGNGPPVDSQVNFNLTAKNGRPDQTWVIKNYKNLFLDEIWASK
jgi:hypothetical protein